MSCTRSVFLSATVLSLAPFLFVGCDSGKADPTAEAPPSPQVIRQSNSGTIRVDHPERFPIVSAGEHDSADTLTATGVVGPDVSRQIPVISLASGRVVDIRVRLGDAVKKGQLLMRIGSTDIASALSDHRKAQADQVLAETQYQRSQVLYDKGAISQNDLQVSLDAEQKAKVDLETTEERLKLLGADKDHSNGIVDIFSPANGVITDQQVTLSSGVQALSAPNPFTVSDLSHVWIVCDVYENDLAFVQLGEYADVHLNAYPDKVLKGRIGNIAAIMDPNLHTAKVRLEVPNPGLMRVGMFVTAAFHGKTREKHAAVPAAAVLHLHDSNWVYVPSGNGEFRRVEVTAGQMLPGNQQEIVAGVKPGDKIVADALVLQNTVEQ